MRICINVSDPLDHVFYDENNDVIYRDIDHFFDVSESSADNEDIIPAKIPTRSKTEVIKP